MQWGRPNLVDPAEWPISGLLNQDFGRILSVFHRKNSKTQSSLNFLQSGPRKFTKSDFSGLAFCPFSIDLHINQAQMSQVSLERLEFVPGTPPGHPTAKFLYVIFLYRFVSLHNDVTVQLLLTP